MREAAAQSKCRRYGIQAPAAQWLAAQDSPRRERAAAQRAVAVDRLAGIGRTTWIKAAAAAEQRTQSPLVQRDQGEQNALHSLRGAARSWREGVDMLQIQGLLLGGS